MHGVLDGVRGNEHVAVKLGDGDVRNDEAVTIRVQDEAARQFIAAGGRGLGNLVRSGSGRPRSGKLLFGLAARQTVPTPGQFLDGAALFELREHFMQGPGVRLPEMKTFGDFVCRGRHASKL